MKPTLGFWVSVAVICSILSLSVSVFNFVSEKTQLVVQPTQDITDISKDNSLDQEIDRGMTTDYWGNTKTFDDRFNTLEGDSWSLNERIKSLLNKDTEFSYRLGFEKFSLSCKNMSNISAKELFEKTYYSDLVKVLKNIKVTSTADIEQHFLFPWQGLNGNDLLVSTVCADDQYVYFFGNSSWDLSGLSLGFVQFNPTTKESFFATIPTTFFFPKNIEKNGDVIRVTSEVLCLGEGDFYTSCNDANAGRQVPESSYRTLLFNIKNRTLSFE